MIHMENKFNREMGEKLPRQSRNNTKRHATPNQMLCESFSEKFPNKLFLRKQNCWKLTSGYNYLKTLYAFIVELTNFQTG